MGEDPFEGATSYTTRILQFINVDRIELIRLNIQLPDISTLI